jgi:Flp pilus assembly protein TadG
MKMLRFPRLTAPFRSTKGSAAIEFGIIAPVLVILLVGVIELGFAVHQAMQVQDAAEAGALYAGKYGWDPAAISNAVVNATGAENITASPAPVQFCGCPDASGIATVACDQTCPSGDPVEVYARVSASRPHTAILTFLNLPIPDTLSGHATVRLQ